MRKGDVYGGVCVDGLVGVGVVPGPIPTCTALHHPSRFVAQGSMESSRVCEGMVGQDRPTDPASGGAVPWTVCSAMIPDCRRRGAASVMYCIRREMTDVSRVVWGCNRIGETLDSGGLGER